LNAKDAQETEVLISVRDIKTNRIK